MKILEFYEIHAITGDAQKAYSEATNEEQEMKQPTPHKHAAMIKEWANDPSRVVEFYYNKDTWLRVDVPTWNPENKFRFADEVTPVKPEIVWSMSNAEIQAILGLKDGYYITKDIRHLADQVAKRAHAEGYQAAINAVCALPCSSNLSQCNFDLLRQANPFEGTWNNANRFAAESIAKFQADVKNKLGGV